MLDSVRRGNAYSTFKTFLLTVPRGQSRTASGWLEASGLDAGKIGGLRPLADVAREFCQQATRETLLEPDPAVEGQLRRTAPYVAG